MSDSKNDNKVVPFPTHKVKPVKVTGADIVEKSRKNQGWTVAASLIFTVFLASYLTLQMNHGSQKVAQRVTDRGIASEDGQVYTNTRSYEEDVFLAKKISKDSLRDPASVGRQPSSRDELTFVFLNSDYLVQEKAGKIIQIVLPDRTNVKPIFAPARPEFFAKYQNLLDVPKGTPVFKEMQKDGRYNYEIYEIKSTDQPTSASTTVKFKLDSYGHFYELKVESTGRTPARE
jgi:hypothetical protein